jgi:hypothetical protein
MARQRRLGTTFLPHEEARITSGAVSRTTSGAQQTIDAFGFEPCKSIVSTCLSALAKLTSK